MLTKTTTNTPKYTDNELRDDWDARIYYVQHRAVKRRQAAFMMDEPDTAKRAALWMQMYKIWFNAELKRSVTEQAPLVIKYLDDLHDCTPAPTPPSARSSCSCRSCRATSSM